MNSLDEPTRKKLRKKLNPKLTPKLKPNSENHWRKFQAKNSETKIQKNIGQIGHKKLDTKRSTKQSTKLDTEKIPVREAYICSEKENLNRFHWTKI